MRVQAGKHCYVFRGSDEWKPSQAAVQAAEKYRRQVWKGRRDAGNLEGFFSAVTGSALVKT